jgi:hypothetical protein
VKLARVTYETANARTSKQTVSLSAHIPTRIWD